MINKFPVNYPEMIVEKSKGATISEKKLISLGFNTFLSLWSYPNPYKKQTCGKELCDLLVVFENHIIIFSDKDCVYGTSNDARTNWRRWYKKAVKKSVEQLIGAKAWIEKYSDRITLDAKCEKPFPIEIVITSETRFHLIAVAHGASEQCKKHFSGGDGGLIIRTQIVGDMHTDDNCEPFCIGKTEEDPQNFVHIFDDASYATVLCELDTIKDFVDYLDIRKKLFFAKTVSAASENDILAQHINGLIEGKLQFLLESTQDYTGIFFEEGLWEELVNSYKYKMWRKKLEKSYFWDNLLQKTFYFIENGLSYHATTPTIYDQSLLFCELARENRMYRYALAESFLSFLSGMPSNYRGTRVIYSESRPDICYVLFLLPRIEGALEEDYRKIRRDMLTDYCFIAKADFPGVKKVIGVAHESSEDGYSSEDFMYLNAQDWSGADQKHALELKEEYQSKGLLGERKAIIKAFFDDSKGMGKISRNKLCPCGSGKKYKRCCGSD